MIVLSGVGHKVYVYFHLLERKPNPTYSEPAIELKLMGMKKLALLPITPTRQKHGLWWNSIQNICSFEEVEIVKVEKVINQQPDG